MGMTDVKEKIKSWLRDEGYPVELRVAAELGRHKISATLANFYRDPSTGQSRQIDVIGARSDWLGFFHAELVIECKRANKHPWLLLSASQTNDGVSRLFEYALTSEGARRALIADGAKDKDAWLDLPWMTWKKSRGVGLIPAFAKGVDDAFKAVSGAMAAALARRKELTDDRRHEAIFVFPVVVVDGLLFECGLDQSHEIELNEIDEARLYFPMHFGEDAGMCVHVTTAKNLENFTRDAENALRELEQYLGPHVESFKERLSEGPR
jgi:hypothetical protein